MELSASIELLSSASMDSGAGIGDLGMSSGIRGFDGPGPKHQRPGYRRQEPKMQHWSFHAQA